MTKYNIILYKNNLKINITLFVRKGNSKCWILHYIKDILQVAM